MLALLRSPRRRKRLGYAGIALLIAAVAVGVGVAYPNTAPHVTQRFGSANARVVTTPPRAPFSEADRRRVEAVLQRFVDHAVARRNPALAYDLVTRSIRGSSTRADWVNGHVPVYPYPAAHQRVQIAWVWASYRNAVDFDVILVPRKGADVGAMAAGVDMVATGTGRNRRWRVDSFNPREFYTR